MANAEDWLAGQLDAPLTELGLQQARAARGRLAEAGWAGGRILSSDLSRAVDTARLAAGEPEQWPELRERNIGGWVRLGRRQLRATGEWDRLLSWEGRPPGGESHLDIAQRAVPALAQVTDPRVLVVAHGGLIRVLLGLLDGVPHEEIGRNKVANADPIVREVAPGRWAELAREIEGA